MDYRHFLEPLEDFFLIAAVATTIFLGCNSVSKGIIVRW